MCGPRQLFTQCAPETPKGWTLLRSAPKVAGSILGQSAYLGCGFDPQSPVPSPGVYWRQPIDVSLSHRCFFLSLTLCLSKSINISKHEEKKEWEKIIANYISDMGLIPTMYK